MLSATALAVLDRHAAEAGVDVDPATGIPRTFVDGRRVEQWDGSSSVFFENTGRLWVHNHTPRMQSYQELYFHARSSVCTTVTCGHTIKLWDLRRALTPRETARLQGFPEDFALPVARAQHLLGNAVAVPCARHALSCVVDGDEPLRHLDICSGIGGFSFALRDLAPSAECAGFSDILPAAVRCYRANFPSAPALGDARAVAAWPAADLVTAGFPCQPFSTANTHKRESDERRDFYLEVLRAVRESGATRVVLENVPQLLTMDGGVRFETIRATLTELGFGLSYAILDSSRFGLAQKRKRVYIVARRDGRPVRDVGAHEPLPPVTIGDVLD